MIQDRYRVRIPATILARSGNVSLQTDFVSFGGVYVRTEAPPALMSLLRMRFDLPNHGGELVLHGMATNVALPGSANGVPGVEISFHAKEGETGMRWDAFIQHIRLTQPKAEARTPSAGPRLVQPTRRAHPRRATNIPLAIESGSLVSQLVATDVSQSGMFIQTQESFAIGAELTVTIPNTSTGRIFTLECIVRRRAFGSAAGIGVEFKNMTPEKTEAFLAFLRPLADSGTHIAAQCVERHVSYVPPMMTTLSGH